jgi:hypothetical protein
MVHSLSGFQGFMGTHYYHWEDGGQLEGNDYNIKFIKSLVPVHSFMIQNKNQIESQTCQNPVCMLSQKLTRDEKGCEGTFHCFVSISTPVGDPSFETHLPNVIPSQQLANIDLSVGIRSV